MSYDPPNTVMALTSRKVARNYVNGSGGSLPQTTPVSTLSSGLVTTVDVSSQASVDSFVGLYNVTTPNSASGQVLDSGIMENVSLGYPVGTPVYISSTGALTNVVPSIGIGGFLAGYYVVFCGVIVQNEFNPSQSDLKILIEKVGTL